MYALWLVAALAFGTHDGGSECSLVAASREGRHAALACHDINDDVLEVDIVDADTGATVLPAVPGSSLATLPPEVVTRYALVEPPAAAPCSPDGRYCLRVLPLRVDMGAWKEPAEDELPQPHVRSTWAVELVTADRKERIHEGTAWGYGGRYGGGYPPPLAGHWLPGHVVIAGSVYNEGRPQWGEIAPIRVVRRLPPAPRTDRAALANALFEAGMELVRRGIPYGAGQYFRWAGELDPRRAPVTCAVSGVARSDVLDVRATANPSAAVVAHLHPQELEVPRLGPTTRVGRSEWILVEVSEMTGWVKGSYLACPGR